MKINAKTFREIFAKEWTALIEKHHEHLAIDFQRDSTWTPCILGDSGLLKEISRKLKKQGFHHRFGREWYTLDAVFVAGQDLFRSELNYPSELSIIVEHENGPHVQEEMWKLIHWRAPLKVLIFYGYPESSSDEHRGWALDAVAQLWRMLDTVNGNHGECSSTEYLLLIGMLDRPGGLPQWQWATSNERSLQPLAI